MRYIKDGLWAAVWAAVCLASYWAVAVLPLCMPLLILWPMLWAAVWLRRGPVCAFAGLAVLGAGLGLLAGWLALAVAVAALLPPLLLLWALARKLPRSAAVPATLGGVISPVVPEGASPGLAGEPAALAAMAAMLGGLLAGLGLLWLLVGENPVHWAVGRMILPFEEMPELLGVMEGYMGVESGKLTVAALSQTLETAMGQMLPAVLLCVAGLGAYLNLACLNGCLRRCGFAIQAFPRWRSFTLPRGLGGALLALLALAYAGSALGWWGSAGLPFVASCLCYVAFGAQGLATGSFFLGRTRCPGFARVSILGVLLLLLPTVVAAVGIVDYFFRLRQRMPEAKGGYKA